MHKAKIPMFEAATNHFDGRSYWQLMPSAVKLEETIKANPPDFVYSFDFFIHLLHLTIEIPAKNDELRRADGYVPLYSAILQSKNRSYHQHLAYLADNQILDVQRWYVAGKASRKYRIAETYLKDQLIEIMVSDKTLVKQLAKQHHLDFKTLRKYEHLHQWFNGGLEIQHEAAMQYCIQQLHAAPYDTIYQAHQQAYGRMFTIKMLQHGQYWFSVDKFGKRLHTNLTNLSSELKPFVTYNRLPLVSIDIKNSQPLLSLKVLASKYPDLDFKAIESRIGEKGISGKTGLVGIMLVKSPQSPATIDVERYARLVMTGKLYDYMETEMRKEFGHEYFTRARIFDFDKLETVPNTLTPRDRVKKVIFQVFFSKNSTRSKEKKLFTKLFPNVMQVFEDCKGKKGVAKNKRHKMLAQQLQRLESALMLDKVAKELSRLKPDLPLFTIHDSIVTTFGNEDFVKDTMLRLLSTELGFAPTLAVDYWCVDCSLTNKAA